MFHSYLGDNAYIISGYRLFTVCKGSTRIMAFHVVDYVVFVVIILTSLATGIYYSVRGQQTASGYIHGNRNLAVLPVSFSMIVTLISPITILVSNIHYIH